MSVVSRKSNLPHVGSGLSDGGRQAHSMLMGKACGARGLRKAAAVLFRGEGLKPGIEPKKVC